MLEFLQSIPSGLKLRDLLRRLLKWFKDTDGELNPHHQIMKR